MRTRRSRPTSSTRHHRQRGDETYFLTGVDEHADKVARVAEEQGLDAAGVRRPDRRRLAGAAAAAERRRTTSSSARAMRATSASSRTSCSASTTTATSTRTSTPAGTASAARRSRPRTSSSTASAPIHGTEPEWLEEKNWFFRLSAYQDRLLALYDERPDFVLPSFRYNEARSFIAGGLRDFSISRATQTWGVPIPWDPEQVAYVWADALVNYLSALSYAPGENLERFWPDVAPARRRTSSASTASTGRRCCCPPAYEPPKQLFVHGYLQLRRPEDVEVARQRHRPARADRRLRRRRRALLRCARDDLRPGRQRLGRRRPRALRARARATTSATSSRARRR